MQYGQHTLLSLAFCILYLDAYSIKCNIVANRLQINGSKDLGTLVMRLFDEPFHYNFSALTIEMMGLSLRILLV